MDWSLPYHSKRAPVFARNMVATSQPLACQAGLAMLQRGGNAVDAALATAICLTVVEPNNNGIGADAFALVWDGEQLHGLNGSGRSPAGWTSDRFKDKQVMPQVGWDAVTVPGAVDLWATLSKRFGKLAFEDLFEPAIRYAREGFVISRFVAWRQWVDRFKDFPEWNRVFAPNGNVPRVGELFRAPDHVGTLEEIARTKGESFYRGAIAQRIVKHAKETGGAMSLADLEKHRSEWVEPIGQAYRGVRLHEIPPNGQGLAALVALGVLKHFDLPSHAVDSADSVHLQIEAMKVGYALAHRHVADPEHMRVSVEHMLDERFLKSCAAEIRMDRAGAPTGDVPRSHGTVYLTAADEAGMMVSLIQSNFRGFGSGVVIPGTGIAMHNRGSGFVLTEGHVNRVGPGKRPFHTILPGFVTRDEGAARRVPLMSFGVMGGHHQAQGHVQMMVRMFDYRQNPQSAIDAPRWHVWPNFEIALEPAVGESVKRELLSRGHRLHDEAIEPTYFGGAQAIMKLENGYVGGSDPRKDGQAVGY